MKKYRLRFNSKGISKAKAEGVTKDPTSYPESETVQGDAYSIKELMQRYNNQSREDIEKHYFDAGDREELYRFLKPNLDFTDLDALKEFNDNLNNTITKAQAKPPFEPEKGQPKVKIDGKPKDEYIKENQPKTEK